MAIASRISRLFRGFVSLFVGSVERSNPEALLETERENLRSRVFKFNGSLAAQAAMSERLKQQVAAGAKEEEDLKTKIHANASAGNEERAAGYALSLERVRTQLKENREQLSMAEALFKDLSREKDQVIRDAKARIDALGDKISNMKVRQAQAELAELASDSRNVLGGASEGLSRLESIVDDETAKAAGRLRVARGSYDTADLDAQEKESKALGAQALAKFLAEENGGASGSTKPQQEEAPRAPAVKAMGPS